MNSSTLSRRNLIVGALASAELPSIMRAARKPDPSKPNVIVILFDDLGLHDLGFLGATDLKTPHIDRLCAEGTRFTNWYSNAPVCAPARSALMTGRYPLRAGVGRN
ncbi:MAG TPA: sulfatase-like hydrolase/transferase, partial [Bryobacteraceae bacterium]|nr:sulfatase-like hydrolase/transferase [Bryobacteraceae bacterium]